MKKNIKWLIIGGVVIIIIASLSIYFFQKLKNGSSSVNTPEKENQIIGGNGDCEEEFYDNETLLNIHFLELFNELFPDDSHFDLKPNESIEFTLRKLKDEYDFDIKDFVNDKVDCNLDKTYVSVTNEAGYLLKGSMVSCIFK